MIRIRLLIATVFAASSGGICLAKDTQVFLPASHHFEPSASFYHLDAAGVDTGEFGRGWYQWETPRGIVMVSVRAGLPFLDGFHRSDIDGTALLAVIRQGTGLTFTQQFASSEPINAVFCRIGAQADFQGGPLIDSVITASFEDGFSYSFPVSAGGLSSVGFYRPGGPDMQSVTFTSSVGVSAISAFGTGNVPSPAILCLLGAAGALPACRRRR